jgi:hypothetical protein
VTRLLLVGLLAAALGGAAQGLTPVEAEASARSLGKPVLLLWQAGPGAPSFTQGFDHLFSTWPRWSAQASLLAVVVRAKSWEGPLPASYPPFDTQTSALVLWIPGAAPTVWKEVPPVLELSQALAKASGRRLDDPYRVPMTTFTWDGGTLTRMGSGPRWEGSGPDGPLSWVEEGPVGTVLVMAEPATGRRAAFPLEDDWSFLYDPAAQSWAPWMVVSHR